MSSNTMIFGIPLSQHELPFKLMQGFGIDTTYMKTIQISSENNREMHLNGFGFLADVAEKTAIRNNKIPQYLKATEYMVSRKDITELLDYYDDLIGKSTHICISACDGNYPILKQVSEYLANNYDKPLILGGPIARKETISLLGNIDADYLNVGGLTALINYLNGNCTSEGFYKKTNNNFHGTGIGTQPEITETTLINGSIAHPSDKLTMKMIDGVGTVSEDNDTIKAIIYGLGNCPNKCSYCISQKQKADISPDAYIKAIDTIRQGKNQIHLYFQDNNPLTNVSEYDKILEYASRNFKEVYIDFIYIDPTVLNLTKDAQQFMEKIRQNDKIKSIRPFIGIECCDETTAEHLGRTYRGLKRTQKMLDKEKETAESIIKTEKIYEPMIAFLIGAIETPESIKRRVDEAEHYQSINENTLFPINTLKIYRGTENYERYKNMLISQFPGILISNLDAPHLRAFEKNWIKNTTSCGLKPLNGTIDFLASTT